jgi:uncharacterized protein (TIGR02118 family)
LPLAALGTTIAAELDTMAISYFVIYDDDFARSGPRNDAFVDYYMARHVELVKAFPGLRSLAVMTPLAYDDPHLGSEAGPFLVAHMTFDDIASLERAAMSDERLAARADVANFPPFEGRATYQAMRDEYRALGAAPATRSRASICYFVQYRRPADDEAAFVDFYRRSHVPLLAEFPGIRELAVFTPVDWRDRPFVTRADLLLANLTAFDSEADFRAALASDARRRVREDFARFPRFTGRCFHTAMRRTFAFP